MSSTPSSSPPVFPSSMASESNTNEDSLPPQVVSSSWMGSASVVGVLTLLSRFFGLARDAVIANVLGTGASADAFYVAFRIPNLLRRMFAEGNLTLSFVPVFTESLHRSKKEAREVADITFTLMSWVLVLVSILGVLGSGIFVRLTAWGFTEDPDKFALTVLLTRITFPYILLVSLGALTMGILNARKHFAAPALSPILLNLGIILGAWFLSRYTSHPSVGIAWGVLLGGLFQLLVQLPPLIRDGFFPRFNFHFRDPAVKKIFRLMLPAVYGSAVYQFNLLAITFMASFLPTGSVSYLWYADRVIELPLGVFAVSLATVALPTFSDHAAQKNINRLLESLKNTLSLVWVLNIPAALGLAVLAEPVISLLFFRGDFKVTSTVSTAQTLMCFSLGLPFVSASRILSSAFYALQDSKKPVLAANLAVLVNVLAGLLLLKPLGHRGLALGVALGSLSNFCFLILLFRKKMGPLGLKSVAGEIVKIVVAALSMGFGLMLLQHFWNLTYAPWLQRLAYVFALILGGAIFYLMVLILLRAQSVALVWRRIRRV